MGPTDSRAKMINDRGVFIAISCEGLHQRARIYQLGLWLAIFFAIFLRLPPNKFLRIPPDLSPVSIRLALLFLLLRAPVARLAARAIEYLHRELNEVIHSSSFSSKIEPLGMT